MIKHLLLSFVFCIGLTSGANAQFETPHGKRSAEINEKIHEVDLLIKVVPLVLTKDQLNKKILPEIEKDRDLYRKELAYEDDQLAKLEPDLDAAIAAAYAKNAYPPRTTTSEVADTTGKLTLQRQIFTGKITDDMIDLLNATLDAGQKKVVFGTFDNRFINPAKPESVTDEIRMRFFVQNVIMDPTTYDILVKLLKTAQ